MGSPIACVHTGSVVPGTLWRRVIGTVPPGQTGSHWESQCSGHPSWSQSRACSCRSGRPIHCKQESDKHEWPTYSTGLSRTPASKYTLQEYFLMHCTQGLLMASNLSLSLITRAHHIYICYIWYFCHWLLSQIRAVCHIQQHSGVKLCKSNW